MKKRLISLLVALCMAVTLLPVSAITAWAEEGGQLKIKNGYPVGSGKNHDTDCSGDDWSYDASTQTLDLHPDSPTDYDFSKLISGTGTVLACALKIGEKATITDGCFINNITNSGTITGGVFHPSSSKSLTFENSGIITGGEFLSASGSLNFTNSISGTIEGGIFSVSSLSNSGAINGGVFPTRPNGNKVAAGYTLNVESPDSTTEAGIEYFKASRYIIPHSSYTTSITVLYHNRLGLQPFPIDVTIDNTQQMLLTEWAGKVESSSDRRVLYVTFTAPPANADTVTLSKLTRLVIDENGYLVGTKGGTQNYSGNGWKFKNGTLILEPATEKSYDFNGTDLNPHGVAVNCPVTVDSNTTITNGIFLKEVTGSALNGVFLNVPTGCENSAKKITVSDNGKITALKMSGEATALDSAANELYVVGQPTGTLYVTLSSGKVREVQLPLTADLELRLNDPAPKPEPEPEPEPKPEPEPETYTLKVVGGSFTTGERDALTSGTVPVDAEAKVTLDPDAVPEGMVFDQWTISEESLLGNPNVAYNAESFTIPANAVENGKTVTVEAQYREASIEDDGPGILETAAMIGVAGTGAAVLGYTGYMIGTELYLNTVLPAGAAIPNNAGELALLLWEAAGTPAPAALLPADAAPVQQALAWAIENQLLAPDASAEDSVTRWEVIRSWNQLKG
jgi:hypothetical protein